MPRPSIEDEKKASIVALSKKYGLRSIANKLEVSKGTVKKYRDMAQEEGEIEMEGADLRVIQNGN